MGKDKISMDAYIQAKRYFDEKLEFYSLQLNDLSKGKTSGCGLVEDSVRMSETYQYASKMFNFYHKNLRELNGMVSNDFKKRALKIMKPDSLYIQSLK